jgi:glycosyltransferase involved in cell wall biosynthesis
MRVLLVHPHLAIYGGAETVVIRLAQYLKKKGVENTILTLSVSSHLLNNYNELTFIIPEKKYPYKVRSTSFFGAMGLLNEAQALSTLVRKNVCSFDLINVHNFPATWSIAHMNRPCVWTCNEPPDLWNNPSPSLPLRALRDIGLQIDRIIVNNYISFICVADKSNASRVLKRYGRKSEIVPYGVDYSFFCKGDKKSAVNKYELEGKFVLLQVGYITPQKNQLQSIVLVKKLKEYIPNVKLILAGDDTTPYARMCKEYVLQNKLQNYVVFTGHLRKDSIRDLYHACDILLHPVLQQGGWLAPFEALCASKPIIVSCEMTASELITKEKIGVVTDNFIPVVLDIYKNPDKYLKMAKKGEQFVAENLTWEKFGEKMFVIFEKAINSYIESRL